MSIFRPSCPTCFMEKGYSTKLKKKGKYMICEKNPNHKFTSNKKGELIPANG